MSRFIFATAAALGLFIACSRCATAAQKEPADTSPGFTSKLRIADAAWFLGRNDTAVLSRDGKWVFSASYVSNNLHLSVFNAITGAHVRDLPMGKTEIRNIASVALSADGKVAAAGISVPSATGPLGEGYEIRTWDFATGKELRTLSGLNMGAMRVGLSADGKLLSSSCDWVGGPDNPFPCELRLFDLATGKVLISLDKTTGPQSDAMISPDGRTFVWIEGKTLHVNDVPAMTERATAPLPPRLDFGRIGISPDNGTLVIAGQHLAMIWDLAAVKVRRSVIIDRIGGGRAAFTSDSKRVAIPFYEKVIFFDTASGQATGAIVAERPKYVPRSISLSGDGSVLATMQGDGYTKGVHLFDAAKLDPPPPLRDADTGALAATDPLTIPEGDKNAATGKATDASGAKPVTPGTPAAPNATGVGATPPPAVKTPQPPASPADPAVFAGSWICPEGALEDFWTITRKDQTWTISVVYMKGRSERGSAHGENASFANGVLTFTRVFDKKPERDFSDNAQVTLESKDGRLTYTATAGNKKKHLTFRRAGAKPE